MDAMVSALMTRVSGSVTLKLYKGSARVVSRTSPVSLYDEDLATFEDGGGYDHADAEGFIKLFGLPLRAEAARRRSEDGAPVSGDQVKEFLQELAGVK